MMMQERGRPQIKEGIAFIFTCLASTAVHLEMVHSMDVDLFLNALKRMTN